MNRQREKRMGRIRRHARVRKRVYGTTERPRLSVFRSLRGIYGQIIDDTRGHTLVAGSSREPTVAGTATGKKPVDLARATGKSLGTRALAAGITAVAFDRGGYKYHGRVRAFAEGAREAGLKF